MEVPLSGCREFCGILVLLVGLGVGGCQSGGDADPQPSGDVWTETGSSLPGKKLARAYCQSCHRLPDPGHLDEKTWRQVVLPRMGHRLGIYEGGERPDSLFEEGAAGSLVRKAGVFPRQARLSRKKWDTIVDYYVKKAPEDLPAPSPHPEISVGLDEFRLHRPSFRRHPPATTLVNVRDTALYVGSATSGTSATLSVLDDRFTTLFQERRALPVPSTPSAMRVVGPNLFLTMMGQLSPTDAPSGRVVKTSLRSGPEGRSFTPLIDSLQRPVHSAYGDLTGDGRTDIVVSEFGFRTGSLSWYEQTGENQFDRHVLRDAPGAVRSVIRDLTGDGRPDVVALMAQGDEGIYLFRNRGEGRFEEERLLRFPPSYGSSSFTLVDFNDDGAMDILHTAGDNADFEPVMRPYHGVRLFLNDGTNDFELKFFFPLDGAYGALARDFDGDEDLDIAAISFFPDYESSRTESFVYLENTGNFEFEAATFPQSSLGRWLVFDSGDVDADGDEDLVLGSFSVTRFGSSYVPERLRKLWLRRGLAVVILENTRF